MSGVVWWETRLLARQPITLWQEDVTFKQPCVGMWPKAVLRSALYVDYLTWFEHKFIGVYTDTGFYRDDPKRLPKPQTALAFYSGLAPFLYIYAKKKQSVAYWVRSQELYEGEWVTIRKRHYFIKLAPWFEHLGAYEAITGKRLYLTEIEPS